jgi:hypothetical protein
MILIINKLIALLPNPQREVFQTRRMVFRGIDPVPMCKIQWKRISRLRPSEEESRKLGNLAVTRHP